MLTEKDYCDYDTCVALKELGYKGKCVAYYDTEHNVGLLYNTQWASYGECYQYFDVLESHNTFTEYYIDAPTLWDAQKWLREEKRICVEITCCASGYVWRYKEDSDTIMDAVKQYQSAKTTNRKIEVMVNGEIKVFASMSQAARELKISRDTLRKYNHLGDKKWRII